jgi:glyceraldehyde-3-phosphate dehydrogenase (NADP+)
MNTVSVNVLSDSAYAIEKVKDDISPTVNQRVYLINGKMVANAEQCEDVFSPICKITDGVATPIRLGCYPLMTRETALQALDAAVKAYDNGNGAWPQMSVADRIRACLKFADAMEEKVMEIAELIMWEIGKTQPDAAKEVTRTIEYIRDTCKAMADLEHESSRLKVQEGFIAQIRRAPLGVVLCMGPFNYPLNETFTTLIPALIMGNTTILKPAKYGVLLLYPLLEAFAKCFPAGVVNTIYGDGKIIVGPIMESGKIDVLAFIGSSKVANILKKQHPFPNRLRCVSGLQAKNIGIVTPSAVINDSIKECVTGSLSFNGQRCTALKLIYVQNSIREEFVRRFTKAVDALKVGLPWGDGVQITPLPEANKVESMMALIRDAVEKGATVVNNNGVVNIGKNIMYPVVLDNVNSTMRIFHEEQFGPIVPIVGFDTSDEPVSAIRNSVYGQQASIFSTDAGEVGYYIDALASQVSRINLNSQCQRGPDSFPFTGRKDSAEGTLSITDALRVFSIRTLVAAKYTDSNKALVSEILSNGVSSFLTTDFLLV